MIEQDEMNRTEQRKKEAFHRLGTDDDIDIRFKAFSISMSSHCQEG